MTDTPFEGGGFGQPIAHDTPQQRRDAARQLARCARRVGADRDGLITALEALGLIDYQEA